VAKEAYLAYQPTPRHERAAALQASEPVRRPLRFSTEVAHIEVGNVTATEPKGKRRPATARLRREAEHPASSSIQPSRPSTARARLSTGAQDGDTFKSASTRTMRNTKRHTSLRVSEGQPRSTRPHSARHAPRQPERQAGQRCARPPSTTRPQSARTAPSAPPDCRMQLGQGGKAAPTGSAAVLIFPTRFQGGRDRRPEGRTTIFKAKESQFQAAIAPGPMPGSPQSYVEQWGEHPKYEYNSPKDSYYAPPADTTRKFEPPPPVKLSIQGLGIDSMNM